MPKRLLLIDPIPTQRIRLRAALRGAQYDVVSTDRIACAQDAIAEGKFDLILLNTSDVGPAKMMTHLRKTIGHDTAPVICRDCDAGPLRRMQALATGAQDMIATDVPLALLLARLRGIFRDGEAAAELERRRYAASSFGFREETATFETPGHILTLTLGSPAGLRNTEALPERHKIVEVSRDALLRGEGQKAPPDAIILNVGSDGDSQLNAVLPEIRSREHLRSASVLVLHPSGAHDIALRALDFGASEVADNGSSPGELGHRLEMMLSRKKVRDALRRSTEESFRMATTDALTGLYNRRYAEVYLSDVLMRSAESGEGLTMMMVDIDHFKSVNDTCGHASGDVVLREVAQRLRDNLRAVDLVSRHGGEEFLVVLPGIDGAEAKLAADRLCAEVSACPIGLSDGSELTVTVSIGVSSIPADWRGSKLPGTDAIDYDTSDRSVIDTLLTSADQALYSAKHAGRNQVSVSPMAA